jgi:hypothetical protein
MMPFMHLPGVSVLVDVITLVDGCAILHMLWLCGVGVLGSYYFLMRLPRFWLSFWGSDSPVFVGCLHQSVPLLPGAFLPAVPSMMSL